MTPQYTTQIMDKLKLLSFNAQGLKGDIKRPQVMNWLKEQKFDILALQETHFEECQREKWEEIWDGKLIGSVGSNNSRGVCLLIHKTLDYTISYEDTDTEGRWIVLGITIQDIDYTIGTYYGPNQDKIESLSAFLGSIENTNNSKIILGGDFNFVFNLELDKLGGNKTTNFQCRNLMKCWMEEFGMLDIWRIHNPRLKQYTWVSNTNPPHLLSSRLFCHKQQFSWTG